VLEVAQSICDARVSSRSGARVLDAGSGFRSYVTFPASVHVTGIDVTQELLDANPRLDARIHADLHEVEIPARSYDCVICWEVLEHLRNPEPVVAKLAGAVADNGLLLIGSPEPRSLKGLVTRFTPHSLHLWVYRRFFNLEASREPGRGPYRTFMKSGGSAEAVQRLAEQQGLTVVYLAWVESVMQVELRRRFRLAGLIWPIIRSSVRALSLGRISAEATDYLCILERRPPAHQEARSTAAAGIELRSSPLR
jgi:SAM-dependent methyltransferase